MFKKFKKAKKTKQDQELNQLKDVYVRVVEGNLEFLKSVANLDSMKFTNVRIFRSI